MGSKRVAHDMEKTLKKQPWRRGFKLSLLTFKMSSVDGAVTPLFPPSPLALLDPLTKTGSPVLSSLSADWLWVNELSSEGWDWSVFVGSSGIGSCTYKYLESRMNRNKKLDMAMPYKKDKSVPLEK